MENAETFLTRSEREHPYLNKQCKGKHTPSKKKISDNLSKAAIKYSRQKMLALDILQKFSCKN